MIILTYPWLRVPFSTKHLLVSFVHFYIWLVSLFLFSTSSLNREISAVRELQSFPFLWLFFSLSQLLHGEGARVFNIVRFINLFLMDSEFLGTDRKALPRPRHERIVHVFPLRLVLCLRHWSGRTGASPAPISLLAPCFSAVSTPVRKAAFHPILHTMCARILLCVPVLFHGLFVRQPHGVWVRVFIMS